MLLDEVPDHSDAKSESLSSTNELSHSESLTSVAPSLLKEALGYNRIELNSSRAEANTSLGSSVILTPGAA